MEQRVFPKIIMHMKNRFQADENHPISLEEILDEMKISDVNRTGRNILDNQILCNNPKLESTIEDGVRKYTFKPIYNLRSRRDVINLIKENQTKGLGGVLLEHVQESMTTDDYDRIFRKPSEEIVIITGKEKKKVLYYNDVKSAENLHVDEDIIKYWREVAVDGLDEAKIEDYLEKQGIASMKDAFGGQAMQAQSSSKQRKPTARGRQVKRHNVHLDNLLNEYNPDLVKKPNT